MSCQNVFHQSFFYSSSTSTARQALLAGAYYFPRLFSTSSSSSRGNGANDGGDDGKRDRKCDEESSIKQSSDGRSARLAVSSRDPVDDFGLDDFLVHDEGESNVSVETVQKQIENTSESELDIGLASELVDRMVAATKSTIESPVKRNLLAEITPHTVSVLRASRIITHTVQASGTDIFKYPIEKRVKAQLWVDELDLSPPAREALLILAGPRVKDRGTWIKLSYDRFPTKEENRAYIITLLDRLVASAKISVGDQVDRTPLADWNDVVEEVRQQAHEEINEAGSIERVLGLGG